MDSRQAEYLSALYDKTLDWESIVEVIEGPAFCDGRVWWMWTSRHGLAMRSSTTQLIKRAPNKFAEAVRHKSDITLIAPNPKEVEGRGALAASFYASEKVEENAADSNEDVENPNEDVANSADGDDWAGAEDNGAGDEQFEGETDF